VTFSDLNVKAENVTADLVEVMRTWNAFLPNLKLLCFYNEKTEHIVVELINIPISHRRQGICGQILDELTVIARGYGVEIWLEPVDVFGVSKQILSSMYMSYGFTWVNSKWMRKQ
jgi:hypothetical protein